MRGAWHQPSLLSMKGLNKAVRPIRVSSVFVYQIQETDNVLDRVREHSLQALISEV